MSPKTEEQRDHLLRLTLTFMLASVVCLLGAIMTVNMPPHLLGTLLGLRRLGPLTTVLPSDPASLTLGGEPLDHVDVILPPQAIEPLTLIPSHLGEDEAPGGPLIGDTSTPGISRYLLSIDEDGVNKLMGVFLSPEGERNDRYRNLAVDLQPGGLIVFADVDLGLLQQRMGLLLLQDSAGTTLSPAGIVWNGRVYDAPDTGCLARLLLPTASQAQHALHALTVVGPLPGEAHVDEVRFHQDHLQIMARATYTDPASRDTGWRRLESSVELREIEVPTSTGQAVERLSIVRLNPAEVYLRVHYDPNDPKTISEWSTTLNALLVVNGSYFAPEGERGHETIGLLISDGQRWGTLLQDYAGMLAVTSAGEVSVRWLRNQPYNPEEPLTQAIQSFPMLVKPGGMMGFPANADDGTPARRTVVAQDEEGNILLVVAPRGALSLHELAAFLAESDLTIDVALNLDGGGSTGMWLAAADTQVEVDSFTAVPSVIAVERR